MRLVEGQTNLFEIIPARIPDLYITNVRTDNLTYNWLDNDLVPDVSRILHKHRCDGKKSSFLRGKYLATSEYPKGLPDFFEEPMVLSGADLLEGIGSSSPIKNPQYSILPMLCAWSASSGKDYLTPITVSNDTSRVLEWEPTESSQNNEFLARNGFDFFYHGYQLAPKKKHFMGIEFVMKVFSRKPPAKRSESTTAYLWDPKIRLLSSARRKIDGYWILPGWEGSLKELIGDGAEFSPGLYWKRHLKLGRLARTYAKRVHTLSRETIPFLENDPLTLQYIHDPNVREFTQNVAYRLCKRQEGIVNIRSAGTSINCSLQRESRGDENSIALEQCSIAKLLHLPHQVRGGNTATRRLLELRTDPIVGTLTPPLLDRIKVIGSETFEPWARLLLEGHEGGEDFLDHELRAASFPRFTGLMERLDKPLKVCYCTNNSPDRQIDPSVIGNECKEGDVALVAEPLENVENDTHIELKQRARYESGVSVQHLVERRLHAIMETIDKKPDRSTNLFEGLIRQRFVTTQLQLLAYLGAPWWVYNKGVRMGDGGISTPWSIGISIRKCTSVRRKGDYSRTRYFSLENDDVISGSDLPKRLRDYHMMGLSFYGCDGKVGTVTHTGEIDVSHPYQGLPILGKKDQLESWFCDYFEPHESSIVESSPGTVIMDLTDNYSAMTLKSPFARHCRNHDIAVIDVTLPSDFRFFPKRSGGNDWKPYVGTCCWIERHRSVGYYSTTSKDKFSESRTDEENSKVPRWVKYNLLNTAGFNPMSLVQWLIGIACYHPTSLSPGLTPFPIRCARNILRKCGLMV